MRKNLAACGLLDQADLCLCSTEGFLLDRRSWNGPYDVIFADPPYAEPKAVEVVLNSWALDIPTADAVMVIEQAARMPTPAVTDRVRLLRRYEYGDTSLLLYQRAPETSAL
jgi:16S rRNA G966 N2-methylase RsmD